MKRALSLAAVLTTALVLAACGGGGGGAPSKSEYIAKADAICKASDKKVNEITKTLSGATTPKEVEAGIDKLLPVVEGSLSDLRDLKRPSGDSAKLDAVYNAVQDGIDKIRAVKDNPSELQALSDPFKDANAKAKAYGFTKSGCGSS